MAIGKPKAEALQVGGLSDSEWDEVQLSNPRGTTLKLTIKECWEYNSAVLQLTSMCKAQLQSPET